MDGMMIAAMMDGMMIAALMDVPMLKGSGTIAALMDGPMNRRAAMPIVLSIQHSRTGTRGVS